MAENDWSGPSSWNSTSGNAGSGADYWTPERMAQAQPMGMWGAPQQQPYASPYGGFGGGMGYGGGSGMQSPYGAPGGMGGYQGSAVMPQPQPQGAPQQQAYSQPQGAPPSTPVPGDSQAPNISIPGLPDWMQDIFKAGGGLMSGKQTTTFEPWKPLGNRYEGLWAGKPGSFTGAEDELKKQQALGPLGFDPSSEAGLRRMEQLAGAGNPFFAPARDAVTGITSGQNRINTGGMFSNMYADPGITGQQQYQNMANRDAINNDQHYRDMIKKDAIGSGQFKQLYDTPGVATKEYNDLAHQNAVGLGNYQNILQGAGGPGSLSGGMFGEVASGGRVDSNPYREKAIQDSLDQTSDQVKATMSARGRFGSDAYGDAMGRALGQVATDARMRGYDTDTAQMMQAAQARSGEDLARQGVGLQAAGGIAGAQAGNYAGRLNAMQGLTAAQSANVAQRMGAAQGLAGLQGTNAAQRLAQIQGLSGIQGENRAAQLGALGQMNQAQQMAANQRQAAAQGLTGVQGSNIANRLQAAGMAPAMNQLRYDDANKMIQAGASREAMAQQQRDFGWGQLNQYRGMLGNLPGAAGQQQSSQQQPWWHTALGLAAGAGGIWGAGGGA